MLNDIQSKIRAKKLYCNLILVFCSEFTLYVMEHCFKTLTINNFRAQQCCKLSHFLQGYSFVAPSVIFGRQHILTDDLLRPQSNSGRPSPDFLDRLADTSESEFFNLYRLDLSSPALGDGSFSVCRRCFEKSTGKEFAVKIMSRRLFILCSVS